MNRHVDNLHARRAYTRVAIVVGLPCGSKIMVSTSLFNKGIVIVLGNDRNDGKLEQFSDSLCVNPSDSPSFASFLDLVCAAIGLIG